ncbi:hypothetical protein [Marilutibacter maris]|uniref:hypothetical protein n=1 Tax=Marilutibacter maris TaxID=1605891 RepID=UPI00147889DB|nr:hypothetical protein [Lysobacter maris]
MYELRDADISAVGGGLEKCEMSTATKVEMAVVAAVSPIMGAAALAAYYASRDC